MASKLKICAAGDLRDNQSIKFTISAEPDPREGFLIRHEGKLTAYYNECAHISLPLDWGDNDFFSLDFRTLVCKNHGAEFQPESGLCVAGPCKGAALKKIEIIEKDGTIFALI